MTKIISISWGVFVAAAFSGLPAVAQSLPSAAEMIRQFDADRDGKLDRSELSRALGGDPPAEVDPTESIKWIRVLYDAKDVPNSLETAVTTFVGASGSPRVDLIGAIHIADQGYYEDLNKLFNDYEVVLYELVAPEHARVPLPGQRSSHPVGRMQEAIKSYLDLSFQLNHIDYTAENFVHADMSPDEFSQSMKDRGESFLQIFFRMMRQAARQPTSKKAPSDADLLIALFAKDRSLRMKRIMAAQFEDLESQMSVFAGPDGSTLITERNKKALQVLRREIEAGRQRIGIFYGSGHMPDMASRLVDEFQLTPGDQKWLAAWDLSDD